MFIKKLWRYPVKSLAGEHVPETRLTFKGIPDDRKILVIGADGRVITSRTHHRLLGLKSTLGENGTPHIAGHPWDSAEASENIKAVAGSGARLLLYEGVERFDVLPLLVATDGAIAHMGFDGRPLRPNVVIGGVEGLAERTWQGRHLRLGNAVIEAVTLRGRCIMTTYDPDTLQEDRSVLKRIVSELGGRMALDCAIVKEGFIREGDPVELLEK
jgi:MOSC domain-containing protein